MTENLKKNRTTANDEGDAGVICCDLSDELQLNSSKFDHFVGSLTYKGEIPSKFRMNASAVDETRAAVWKTRGDDHFASKRFQESVTAYTNGIASEHRKGKLWLELLSSRSAAYLELCNYNLALIDAQSVLAVDGNHIKCILRRAKSLIGLARYKETVSFLKNLTLDISKDDRKCIDDLILKSERFMAQSEAGDYPWKDILSNTLPVYCHDIAEYKGAVVVKDSLNKGRGLFAADTIRAGQLILASRAFAIVELQDADKGVASDKTQLVEAITKILTNCPEKRAEFYSLYGGTEYSNEISSQDLQIDVKRIQDICRYNSFGYDGIRRESTDTDMSGIWIAPSFINHSCVDANSLWMVNGDFIFVRAYRDIPKDEEISICYLMPLEPVSQMQLEKYGFTCDCRLCKRDRQDSQKTQTQRSQLQSRLNELFVHTGRDKFDKRTAAEARAIFNLLKELRKDAPELNIFFMDTLVIMTLIDYRSKRYLECAVAFLNLYTVSKAYSVIGQKETATLWFAVLKEKCMLYYGSEDAVDFADTTKIVELCQRINK